MVLYTKRNMHEDTQVHFVGGTIICEYVPPHDDWLGGHAPTMRGANALKNYIRGQMPETPDSMCTVEFSPKGPVYNGEFLQMPDAAFVVYSPLRDATDMHYEEYNRVAHVVLDGIRKGYRRQKIVSGTDSGTYASAFFPLRFAFAEDTQIIILMAMESILENGADAIANTNAALSIPPDWPGAYTCINSGEVLRSSRAVKVKAREVKNGSSIPPKRPFESVNYPVIATVSRWWPQYLKRPDPKQQEYMERVRKRNELFSGMLADLYPVWWPYFPHYGRVFTLDLEPNVDPERMEEALCDTEKNYRAAVIKATGTGGVFDTPEQMAIIPIIRKWTDKKRPVIITSRVVYSVVQPIYEVDMRAVDAGAIPAFDTPSECVVAKTEFGSGLGLPLEDFGNFMRANLAGEITEGLMPEAERTTDEDLLDILIKAPNKISPAYVSDLNTSEGPEMPQSTNEIRTDADFVKTVLQGR